MAVHRVGMTTRPGHPTDVDWSLLEAVLRVTAAPGPPLPAFEGDDGLPVFVPDVGALLNCARLLVLDGRADPASLLSLACRGAWLSWQVLLRQPSGTTASVAAVLEGWEEHGLDLAGHEGTPGAGGGAWTGRRPSDVAQVFAVWHAVRAATAGADPGTLRRLARDGTLTPDEAWEAPDMAW